MSRQTSCNHSRINPLRLLAGLLAAGLSVSAFAQSVPFPTYTPGENQTGTQGPNYPSSLPYPWVVSDGTIITPAGTQVYLGTTTRAKAIALNPNTSNAHRRRPANGRAAGRHHLQHPDRRCPAERQVRHL